MGKKKAPSKKGATSTQDFETQTPPENDEEAQPNKRTKITEVDKGKGKGPSTTSKADKGKAPLEATPTKAGKRKAPEHPLIIKIAKGKGKATIKSLTLKKKDVLVEVKPSVKKSTSVNTDEVQEISDDEEPLSAKVRQSTVPFQNFLTAIGDQPAKRQAIIDMGFGGLLELDLPKNDPIFCAELLSKYCVGSGCLLLRRDKEIDIREMDVHLVYGLPLGGLEVDESKESDAEYQVMLEGWRAYIGVQRGSPFLSTLSTHLADAAVPVTDNWKRTFLVMAVNSCIKSTQNPQPLTHFLTASMDVNDIRNYNWCKYTTESLLHSARTWQQDPRRFFSGPMPFLQESYDKTFAQCEERGETKAPNQIFFETVGGRKKGWVPGLGTSADLYFERSSRGGGSSSSSCTPSMFSQLSARFEEERAEMQRERERMQKEREEERIARQKEREEDCRVHDEYLAQMRATMETYIQMMS
ncbi:hypothetical protein BVRB_2g038600 [Beta vulgaris subsp. vulgaris]|nr:hypothetical protein BVRB_2g038600 [Beta vulgaris subsp. vulgaris]